MHFNFYIFSEKISKARVDVKKMLSLENDLSLWFWPLLIFMNSSHHCGYGLRQWETLLQCHFVSDWPSPYPEWSWSSLTLAALLDCGHCCVHYCDVIMGVMASQITSLTIVYSTVYSDTDQRKHQSSASLAFVRGIHRGPVNSPHKWPVTRKMFPFDDVNMYCQVSSKLNTC